MKYIKSFKIFESNEEDIKSDVNDILIDLIDDKARINVDFFKGSFQGKDLLDITIYFDNMYNDGIDVSKYKDNIIHLLSYVGEDGLGFEFSELSIGSDEDYDIICPECGSEDIEYGEQDYYKNGAIMNTCNVCGHKEQEDSFLHKNNKLKKFEEVKEFFSKPNGYEVSSVTFEFIKK